MEDNYDEYVEFNTIRAQEDGHEVYLRFPVEGRLRYRWIADALTDWVRLALTPLYQDIRSGVGEVIYNNDQPISSSDIVYDLPSFEGAIRKYYHLQLSDLSIKNITVEIDRVYAIEDADNPDHFRDPRGFLPDNMPQHIVITFASWPNRGRPASFTRWTVDTVNRTAHPVRGEDNLCYIDSDIIDAIVTAAMSPISCHAIITAIYPDELKRGRKNWHAKLVHAGCLY